MRVIIFFFMGMMIGSCSQKQVIPVDILAPVKMQAVLWDMLRADEYVSNYKRKDTVTSLKDKSTGLYDEVFRIHKITRSQFEKSINFYNLHPDLFKIVIDSLERKKSVLVQEPYRPHAIDSLHKKIKSPGIHP
jgi:hypothetical protein